MPVSSREFPALLFGGIGTLLHYSPSLQQIIENLSPAPSEQSKGRIEMARLRALRRLNQESESQKNFLLDLKHLLHLWSEELGLPENDRGSWIEDVQTKIQGSTKIVLARTVVDVLEQLSERGYRLGAFSSWRVPLADLLRLYGILDLFDVVIESEDASQDGSPSLFDIALEEFDVSPKQAVMIGHSFAGEIVGSLRSGIQPVLYDPQFEEVRALTTEDTSNKVVSLEALRHNRRLQGTKVITKFEDLLGLFQ